jgi:hypothetical protein
MTQTAVIPLKMESWPWVESKRCTARSEDGALGKPKASLFQ